MTILHRPLTRRLFGTAAAAALAGSLVACNETTNAATGDGVEIAHAQGTTTVTKDPQRIVALDFGALDTLNALGLADRVVGIPKGGVLPAALDAFKDDKYANVGTLAEPNIEAINKLRPDLVITGFRSAAKYSELSKHFPTIDVTYNPEKVSFAEGVKQASTIIGQAVGKQSEVTDKLDELTQAITAAKAEMPPGKGMILMTSAGKVTLHGKGSRFDAIHQDLGVTPAIAEVKEASHGDPISFEAIQKANPDVLFVIDRDAAVGQQGQAAQEVLDNELVATTTAWKNKSVVYLDGQRWYLIIHGLDNAVAMIKGTTQGL